MGLKELLKDDLSIGVEIFASPSDIFACIQSSKFLKFLEKLFVIYFNINHECVNRIRINQVRKRREN